MANIIPVPASRVSDALTRIRTLSQIQFNQQALIRVQTQVSTGYRYSTISEDSASALRAIKLQTLLERKSQIDINVAATHSYLAASDASVSSVSTALHDIQGAVLSVVDSTASQSERDAVAQLIDHSIEQFLDIGNQQFRGRFLLGGSRTNDAPYGFVDGYVEYTGNERHLETYVNLDVLFDTNSHGPEVLGGVSEAVRTNVDLNPQLNPDTLLSSLNRGQGITPGGAIAMFDGLNTSIIDLSKAATLGDVARLIEASPPAGRTVRVDILPHQLAISLDAAGGTALSINEVGGGRAARELGILQEATTIADPLIGKDLNRVLSKTTALDDILGSKAFAAVEIPGKNNDVVIRANHNGEQFSGVAIQFVDSSLTQAGSGVGTGSEYAEFDPAARAAQAGLRLTGLGNDIQLTATAAGADFNNVTIELVNAGDVKSNPTVSYSDTGTSRRLTIGIDDSNETTIQDVIDAINTEGTFTAAPDGSSGDLFNPAAAVATSDAGVAFGDTGNSGGDAKTLYVFVEDGDSTARQVVDAINAEGTFAAQLDPRDAVTPLYVGLGTVDVATVATTTGGSGDVFDRTGLVVENRGQQFTIDFTAADTIEDVLNAINGSQAGLLAEINRDGTGIDVRSRISGTGFGIGENGGNTAAQLGIRTFRGDTTLAELNLGVGVPTTPGTDFTIVANDGTELDIDVSAAVTVQDVIDIINNHPANHTGTTAVDARLAAHGNGIELIDETPVVTNPLEVRPGNSAAATFLGFVERNQPASTATISEPAAATIDFTTLNSDLAIAAAAVDTQYNGATIEFVSSGSVTGDNATATYNAGSNTLTVDVDPTATTSTTVRDAINGEGTFVATLDTSKGANDGSGVITELGVLATLADATPARLTSRDTNLQRTASAFDSLLRIRDALRAGDQTAITNLSGYLDEDVIRVNLARAEIGARQQTLEFVTLRLEDERIELRTALSNEIDVDFAEAVTDLTARQLALEASFRTANALFQQSLLDFI